MSSLSFNVEWVSYPEGDKGPSDATAHLSIVAGSHCLTSNESLLSESRSVQDSIVVSPYPLAEWFAGRWWRLNYEPLPADSNELPHDWRMSHEMIAANDGIVWPAVTFATDGDVIQIWADNTETDKCSPVKYLTSTSAPVLVPVDQFQKAVSLFIEDVLEKLSKYETSESDLTGLWGLVQSETADKTLARTRRLEARMGYDSEECPENLLKQAISLEERLGKNVLQELVPAYAKQETDADLKGIEVLIKQKGIVGTPQIDSDAFNGAGSEAASDNAIPWMRAVEAAKGLRKSLALDGQPITDSQLYDLLGLKESKVGDSVPAGNAKASVAKGEPGGKMNYISRKRHPIAKRFEFSRFIADQAYRADLDRPHWLVETDLFTSRQKFQRAFAAEFLCPIESLVNYTEYDFSDTSIENAADHFSVSDWTIRFHLMNNGYMEPNHPYPRYIHSSG